jgi:hypothetical protein
VDQKKQSVYDMSDSFLTHDVKKCGQSLDLEANVLVLSSVETSLKLEILLDIVTCNAPNN